MILNYHITSKTEAFGPILIQRVTGAPLDDESAVKRDSRGTMEWFLTRLEASTTNRRFAYKKR